MLSLYNKFEVYQTQDIISHTIKSATVKPKYSQIKIDPCQIKAVISLLLSVLFEVVVGVFYRHYFVSKFWGSVHQEGLFIY